MSLAQLKNVSKKYNVQGCTHYGKPELLKKLKEKSIPTNKEEEETFRNYVNDFLEQFETMLNKCPYKIIQEIANQSFKKELNQYQQMEHFPDYSHLKTIRKNSKQVVITDVKSGQSWTYSSIHQAAKALSVSSALIIYHNGEDKILKGTKYSIQIKAHQ